MSVLDVFRSTVGAAALGFARRALDETVSRVGSRELFGAPTVQSTELHLMIEVKDAAQGDALIAAMEAADYVVRRG